MTSVLISSDGITHKIKYDSGLYKLKTEQYLSGLTGTRYVGYHNDDPSWFLTATPHGDTNTLTSIDNFSSSPDFAQQEYYSWEWIGYFKPSSSEAYTFYTSSDDGSYLWIGESANSPTLANVLVNNGGPHGNQQVSASINLEANTYYPFRVQFGEIGGGDIITVGFSTDTLPYTTNGLTFYFH